MMPSTTDLDALREQMALASGDYEVVQRRKRETTGASLEERVEALERQMAEIERMLSAASPTLQRDET